MVTRGAFQRLVVALGLAFCGSSIANGARATVASPCGTIEAYARPGPIRAGQAAVRFVPTADVTTVDASLLTLADADGKEIALSVENLPDGSAFLRAGVDLEPGTYELSYAAACYPSKPFTVELEVTAGTADPTTLGDLTLDYEPYCVGYHADGTGAPPITATVALSDDVLPYVNFLTLDLEASGNATWANGVVPLTQSDSLVYARPSACTPRSEAIPLELSFSATASIVDGPLLPPLTASVDATCADCSAYVGGGGTASATAAANDGELGTNPPRHGGCTFGRHGEGDRPAVVALMFAACVALRRRRSTRRAGPTVTEP